MTNSRFKKLVRELKADIEDVSGDPENPSSPTDAFTDQILQSLTEEGHWPQHTIAHFKHPRKASLGEISAFGVDEDSKTLYLSVTEFDETLNEVVAISKQKITAKIKKLRSFYENATKGSYEMDVGSEAEAACRAIEEGLGVDFNSVKFTLLTNQKEPEDLELSPFDDFGLSHTIQVVGIERIAELYDPEGDHGPVDVDFVDLAGEGFPCLPAAETQKNVKIYSAFIPGKSLGLVYSHYGPRLLELNVRSFLQATGKVNKGIRETIEKSPQKFLSFNNGITVTSSKVELDENSHVVTLKDMQVVNGGQTTASLSRALNDNLDLSKIFVHMKIVEVPQKHVAKVVPEISRFANRQNAVNEADLTAHHPFHVKLEEIAQEVPVTATGSRNTYWYYERMKGAHRNLLAEASTAAQKKKLLTRFPKRQKFTKTDLAKYHNTWAGRPWMVARGATKNFTAFMVDLETGGGIPEMPNEDFFKQSVAKAILFREADKIVNNQGFGGWKAQITCFTLAYISKRINGQLDYKNIWESQALSENWHKAITVTCHEIQQFITNPEDGQNIGEYCKKETTWEAVQLMDVEHDYFKLIDFEYVLPANESSDQELTNEQEEALAWTRTISANEIQNLAIWIMSDGQDLDNKLFSFRAVGFVPQMATRMNAGLEFTPKQATWLKTLWEGAKDHAWV